MRQSRRGLIFTLFNSGYTVTRAFELYIVALGRKPTSSPAIVVVLVEVELVLVDVLEVEVLVEEVEVVKLAVVLVDVLLVERDVLVLVDEVDRLVEVD